MPTKISFTDYILLEAEMKELREMLVLVLYVTGLTTSDGTDIGKLPPDTKDGIEEMVAKVLDKWEKMFTDPTDQELEALYASVKDDAAKLLDRIVNTAQKIKNLPLPTSSTQSSQSGYKGYFVMVKDELRTGNPIPEVNNQTVFRSGGMVEASSKEEALAVFNARNGYSLRPDQVNITKYDWS